jgi:chromosome segregation ATPase
MSPTEKAHAEETIQLATTTQPILDTVTVIAQTIESANTAIAQAETTTAEVKIDAQAITSPTETITATIAIAEDSILQAKSVVDSATVAIAHKQEAETATAIAIAEKNIAISNLETATATLQLKTTAFDLAKSAVDSQTVVVNTETAELTALQNTPSNSVTYTTAGYVAPQTIDTNVVSTVVLPPMGDASTKITTPFDIKLGGTMYEGQGTNSQLYVTSKSALTFGAGDHTYWDWPQIAGLYIFQSDYMSSGPGASITVTTTLNTLAISWDLHRFGDNYGPITNTDLFMIVNTDTGEWTATASIAGNTSGLYGGPRTGVREVTGEAVKTMTSVGNADLQAQITAQQAVVQEETAELNSLITIKNTAASEKTLATQQVNSATVTYNSKNAIATSAIANLAYATTVVDQAVALISPTIANMNSAVSAANSVVQNKLAEEEAERQEAARVEAERQAAIAAANALAAYQAQLQAEAEAKAAAEAAAQAEADRIAAEQAAAEQAEQDRLAEEEAAKAEAEAKAQAEADAKAEAEAKAAEEAAQKAEEEAKQAEQDAMDKAIEDALDGKELTEEQKELVTEALLEKADGEAISAEDIKEAGLDYKDLPPDTPVKTRTDSSGNPVVITAAVAASLELVANPTELLSTAFSDPGAALAALGSVGADMSEEEREGAKDMVVATVVAAGAAINAVAATGSSGSSGGSSGGSSSGANSGASRRNGRW